MSLLKFAVWLLVIIILVGCQVDPTGLVSAASENSSQTNSIDNADPSPAQSDGQLAYIGSDGNIYVTTANRETTIAITNDATTFPEKEGFSYHRLAWSPGGSLAFAGLTRTRDENFSSQLYVVESPGEPARVVGQSDKQAIIYIYWSPVSCSNGPMCQRLAYLIEEDESIALHVVEMKAGQVENRVAGLGQPFYFAWAPDGRQMLWHIGGARRHNEQGRLSLYDTDTDQLQTLPYTTGLFFAPAWSPEGNRWLGVSADEATDQLQIFDDGQPTTLTSNLDGQIVFLWSPTGDQVAYAKREGIDPIFGPIYIFDLKTGQSKRITAPRFLITGFFWSPDGQRIAYLPKLIPDTNRLQWRIYDLGQNEDRGFAAFTPSFQMWFMISSFNQYAQSHSFWSPDSRYLVYANRDASRVERVWLIDTWAKNEREPILIDEGSIGVWSWN